MNGVVIGKQMIAFRRTELGTEVSNISCLVMGLSEINSKCTEKRRKRWHLMCAVVRTGIY